MAQSGVWRLAPKTGGDAEKLHYAIRVHAPGALAVLPRVAIAAMTKTPPPGGCAWCTVHYLVALSFGEEVEPERTDLLVSFLSNPCRRCQARHASDTAVIAALREETARQAKIEAEVAAAGGPLAHYRAKQQRDQAVAPYGRRIDRLAAQLGCDRELVVDGFHAALTRWSR